MSGPSSVGVFADVQLPFSLDFYHWCYFCALAAAVTAVAPRGRPTLNLEAWPLTWPSESLNQMQRCNGNHTFNTRLQLLTMSHPTNKHQPARRESNNRSRQYINALVSVATSQHLFFVLWLVWRPWSGTRAERGMLVWGRQAKRPNLLAYLLHGCCLVTMLKNPLAEFRVPVFYLHSGTVATFHCVKRREGCTREQQERKKNNMSGISQRLLDK